MILQVLDIYWHLVNLTFQFEEITQKKQQNPLFNGCFWFP